MRPRIRLRRLLIALIGAILLAIVAYRAQETPQQASLDVPARLVPAPSAIAGRR